MAEQRCVLFVTLHITFAIDILANLPFMVDKHAIMIEVHLFLHPVSDKPDFQPNSHLMPTRHIQEGMFLKVRYRLLIS